MGHEVHNEDKIKSANKSKTFKAAKELCVKYLCEENTALYNKVSNAHMYITYTNMNKMAKKEFNHYPTNDNVIVDTQEKYKEYFRSPQGSKRDWMILKEFPELSEMHDALYLDVWFFKQNEVV
jgi:hypothetical protein